MIFKTENEVLLPSYVDNFLNYLIAIKSLSYNYTRAIRTTMRQFLQFINSYKLKNKYDDISMINENDIRMLKNSDIYCFIYYLQENEYEQGTRILKTNHLKAFFDYMLNIKHQVFQQPFKKIHSEKRKIKHLPRYLSFEESKQLLDVYAHSDKPKDIKMFSILTMFLNCGLRLSELVNLKISDIDLKDNKITILGKGNKERISYLNKITKNALIKYLEIRNTIVPANKKDNDILFLDEEHKAISKKTIWCMVKDAYEKSGLNDKKYAVHTLRHTCATLLYRNGIPVKTIQELLGHTSIDVTQIYTHLYDKQVMDAMLEHPLSQFKMQTALTY